MIFTENRMPIEVATPFPPLKFNVIGKTCPISKKMTISKLGMAEYSSPSRKKQV